MKYSILLASLAASAVAIPFVDIVVGEDAVTSSTRRDHRHHGTTGWLSSLLGSSRSHSRHRGNRRHRHNSHRHHHALGLGDGDDDGNPIEGEQYECVLTAKHNRDERENTRRCCSQQGGQLYESRGHCIFREFMGNPHEEWQACGMMARGTDFAACYQREQREIEDELAGRGWHSDEEKHRRHHSRHGRHGSHDHHARKHHGGRMNVLDDGDDDDNDDHYSHHGKHGRHHRKQEVYGCRIDLDDENRRHDLLEHCCEDQVRGHVDPESQMCWDVRRRDTPLFENCAMALGAQNAECHKPDDNNGGDGGGHDGDHSGDDDGKDDRY
ncbi:hypothetical protein FKW77_008963 [Venturia effusa]|uniref:Extracellular membrane protein CFEM domain-containing protein n=1 Tax=Venturia effusa TaxID=50376 RepID=A0A517KX46_9PEZI|nr:hypothetical protein FKW77_008963 [Venturia effusa]